MDGTHFLAQDRHTLHARSSSFQPSSCLFPFASHADLGAEMGKHVGVLVGRPVPLVHQVGVVELALLLHAGEVLLHLSTQLVHLLLRLLRLRVLH